MLRIHINAMVSRVARSVENNTSLSVRRIFVLASLICIFQQFHVFQQYSRHSLLLIAQEQNPRSLTTAPLLSPSAKGDEKIETIGKTTDNEQDTMKIVNRIIFENKNSSTDTDTDTDNQKKKKADEYEDDIERAMFVISMGKKAAQTRTIERFVYSAREIGKYSGWIVVLTDAFPGRYDGMNNWTEKVIIMEPKKEDTKDFKVQNMIYKRFKTHAIEYMDRDPRLDHVELVYYLDADIVFGDNMNKAFNGLETSYGIGRLGANSTNTTSLGRGKMWMFKGNSEKWLIQGGQIILDRYKSQPCLERWRKGFDEEESVKMGKDQYLLMAIKREMDEARNTTLLQPQSKNITALECEIVMMEQSPYIEFPTVPNIKKRSGSLRKKPTRHYDYSPMVHVRNDGGTATMKDKNIKPYMANLLRFGKKQKDHLGILKKVRMETTS